MVDKKLRAGSTFPDLRIETLQGDRITLAVPHAPYDWRMVVVYRGKHCPICTRYLGHLNNKLSEINKIGIDVIAVSADTREQADQQTNSMDLEFDIGYGLTVDQMSALGLYISIPRSSAETDHPFAEPGLFIVNENQQLQIVDISNAPFARPDLSSLIMGLKFIRNPENNYPIRGTYQ